ncbi:conserved hypothetical protein [Sporisorium reilianum SRZ2]|uniref:Amine oxidase domain-containing protein n=1 Tax=Sporisorium reilianum (strain SRZ2) TaxID=999809 RepID=E6ZR47_SPORE|nr:conserved hypothetical protein [Sporisorium reilianum SRZ2]
MKIAVVGGGVSGLSSIWALNEYSSHEVHLFEPLPWIGGHANTVTFTSPTSASPASAESTLVDTGFIVFNRVTYPNFLRFLQHTGVEILNSDMSFSVTRFISALGGYGGFEWAGGSPAALFCQPSNLLNPGHWRMVWDIIRFNQQSVDYLRLCKANPVEGAEISIGEWLDERGYSKSFRKNYLIPMTASIWSTAPETALSSFPALTLLRFMHNHHLLQILDRPQWLTIKNGSRSYVDRIVSHLPQERIHQGNQKGEVVAAWIDGRNAKWTLKTADGAKHSGWDRVIFAAHADETLKMFQAGEAEGLSVGRQVLDTLARFQFSQNVAVLHADTRLMPVRRAAWSAWNFLAETVPLASSSASITSSNATLAAHGEDEMNGKQLTSTSEGDVDRVSLTYWMNLLQSLPESKYGPVLVTLNPTTSPSSPYTPRPELVLKRQAYAHPLYTPDTVLAQTQLKPLQGTRGAFFAGAWTNYGFHEDGFSSGLRAAEAVGEVYLPFDVRDAERSVPASKEWACTAVEVVDGYAKGGLVTRAVQVVLVVLVHALALVEVVLVVLGGKRGWMDEVGRVKGFLGESVAEGRTAAKVKSV